MHEKELGDQAKNPQKMASSQFKYKTKSVQRKILTQASSPTIKQSSLIIGNKCHPSIPFSLKKMQVQSKNFTHACFYSVSFRNPSTFLPYIQKF